MDLLIGQDKTQLETLNVSYLNDAVNAYGTFTYKYGRIVSGVISIVLPNVPSGQWVQLVNIGCRLKYTIRGRTSVVVSGPARDYSIDTAGIFSMYFTTEDVGNTCNISFSAISES